MSLETWQEEHYPVPANSDTLKTAIQSIKHSLQKWIGLRFDNLEKHGIRLSGRHIHERGYLGNLDKSLRIDTSSCSLCVDYLVKGSTCYLCPLYKRLGVSCDTEGQPYVRFCESGDPEPMIKALEEIKAMENISG